MFQTSLANAARLEQLQGELVARECKSWIMQTTQRGGATFQIKDGDNNEVIMQISSISTGRCKASAQVCITVCLGLYDAGASKAQLLAVKQSGALMGYIIGRAEKTPVQGGDGES